MQDLASLDLTRLLQAVSDLNSGIDSRDISERVMTAVNGVIPCELIALDSFAVDGADDPLIHWDNNPEMLTPAIGEACAEVFTTHPKDNPLIVEQVFRRNRSVLMLADFVSDKDFRETVYFNEIMRPAKFDRQMAVMLQVGAGLEFSCTVNRKGSRFSERDRTMLAMLKPHLSAAIANDLDRRARIVSENRLSATLDEFAGGVIILSPDDKMLHLSVLAEYLIVKYFSGSGLAGNGLPKPLMEWTRSEMALMNTVSVGPNGFSLDSGQAGLNIAGRRNPETGELTLRLKENRPPHHSSLESLGLTPRQAEVLHWIAQGKTDQVIASLLGTSRRTVEKHAEKIYEKLGVETRTAASAAVRDLQSAA